MRIRPALSSAFLLVLVVPPVSATASRSSGLVQSEDCGGWQDCRDRALAAKEAGEFERFHDLAWRAVQNGPRNDASLMTLLARAQSLSGRPGDALVMLQRLAGMGVAVADASESEDFRRVRALPGWADLQARLAELSAPAAPAATPPADKAPAAANRATAEPKPAAPAGSVPKGEAPKTVPAKPSAPAPATGKPPAAAPEPARAGDDDAPGAEVDDAVRFTTIPFEPAGLVYDAVSTRFIVGDRRDRKLNVIGERSQRIATLAGEESAGFGEIEAIAIDPREGDLWVASTPDGEPSKLHKLQLISGRLLFTATLPEQVTDARFADIEVDRTGVVLALDSAGRRLFALKPGTRELEVLPGRGLPGGTSLAVSPGGAIYVAGPEGLLRVESTGRHAPVRAASGVDLTGLARIRWHDGALVGVQRTAAGTFRIVRLRLDTGGRRVTRIDVLEKDVALASPTSMALRGDELFYLARPPGYSATGGMDVTIRRLKLR